jgi:DHA1 family inner membrane transport protein
LRAFTRPQVWFTLGIGAIGFGGLFALYTYIAPIVTEVAGLPEGAVPLMLVCCGLGMTVGNLVGGAMADRSVKRTMLVFFVVLMVALVGIGMLAQNWVVLAAGVFLVGGSSSAISPAIQTRLMDVARDSQSIAAALNHSALNIGNSLGAYLGGVAIAAGLGYRAPVWVGLVLSMLGLLLAMGSFTLDRVRAARGLPVAGHTAGIPTRPIEVG